jgi:hypothetical protein
MLLDLTPHPYRGQRNEPARLALVCEQLALLYGISPQRWQLRPVPLHFVFTVWRIGSVLTPQLTTPQYLL